MGLLADQGSSSMSDRDRPTRPSEPSTPVQARANRAGAGPTTRSLQTRKLADLPQGAVAEAPATQDVQLKSGHDEQRQYFDDPFGLGPSSYPPPPPPDEVPFVQRKESGTDDPSSGVHELAVSGTSGPAQSLPFLDQIQASFGAHDVAGVQAHTGEEARAASAGMGAAAFATGNHVAFGEAPDLHTAAHEAAHVVQQRAGVQLKGGVGVAGDDYERNADDAAAAVVRGDSAAPILDQYTSVSASAKWLHGGPVQKRDAAVPAKQHPNLLAPKKIEFNEVQVGDRAREERTLWNDSEGEIRIASASIGRDRDQKMFRIEAAPTRVMPTTNPSAEASGRLVVDFQPTSADLETDVLHLHLAPSPGEPVSHIVPIVLVGRGRTAGSAAAQDPSLAPDAKAPNDEPPLDLNAGRRDRNPDQCRPLAAGDLCGPNELGQGSIKELRATRIHNPGTAGEFRDPVATTLYPKDELELEIEIAGKPAGELSGWLRGTAGMLNVKSTTVQGQTIKIVAQAVRPGKAIGHLEVFQGGDVIVRTALRPIDIVPADNDGAENGSERVKTTDIDSAIKQISLTARSVLVAQTEGVHAAKAQLLSQLKKPTVPWHAELLAIGAEAALAFMTAGIGNRLGRALVAWKVGFRDLDLGKIPVFDLESAFGTGMREGLKGLARSNIVSGSEGHDDGTTVAESWAIDLFCEAQILALTKAQISLEGDLNNGAKSYKDLEAQQAGLGLSAAEAHRHALASTKDEATSDARHATALEWFKVLSQSTHGTVDEGKGAPGTDLGNAGRGHLDVHIAVDPAGGAPRATSMAIGGIANRAPSWLHGRIRDLGLPFVVHLGNMKIKKNEGGQVWIETLGTLAVLGGDLSLPFERLLYQRGTGRTDWIGEAEFRAGVDAGAERLLSEVEVMEVMIP